MKPSELFPGAYVHCLQMPGIWQIQTVEGHWEKVVASLVNGEESYDLTVSIDSLLPISLDENWLTSFKIIHIPHAGSWQITEHLLLDPTENKDVWSLHVDHINFVGNIAYVHSLQGLVLHLNEELLTL